MFGDSEYQYVLDYEDVNEGEIGDNDISQATKSQLRSEEIEGRMCQPPPLAVPNPPTNDVSLHHLLHLLKLQTNNLHPEEMIQIHHQEEATPIIVGELRLLESRRKSTD